MSWTRRFIWAFWIFVITMLLWQAYQYNAKISAPAEHPTPEHFFFYQHTGKAAGPVEHDGPFVEQTGFDVLDNTPTDTSFTCRVTLKNTGKAKAINVGMSVSPFKGALAENVDDGGRNDSRKLSEADPLTQIKQWVSFPDLDPGQSVTQSVVFTKVGSSEYGTNPKPQIVYEPEKK